MLRVLCAVVATAALAASAPAQYVTVPVQQSVSTATYEQVALGGGAVGTVYAVSADGNWVAGITGPSPGLAFRMNRRTAFVEIDPIPEGYAYSHPSAISSDGVAVNTGMTVGFEFYASIWHTDGTYTQVLANHGPFAPTWTFMTANTIEPVGGGNYAVTGFGSNDSYYFGGYRITGPLPR